MLAAAVSSIQSSPLRVSVILSHRLFQHTSLLSEDVRSSTAAAKLFVRVTSNAGLSTLPFLSLKIKVQIKVQISISVIN
jgi:hypothetical protein